MFYTTMTERLSQTELPRGVSFDQQLLRDLRSTTHKPVEEPAPA